MSRASQPSVYKLGHFASMPPLNQSSGLLAASAAFLLGMAVGNSAAAPQGGAHIHLSLEDKDEKLRSQDAQSDYDCGM